MALLPCWLVLAVLDALLADADESDATASMRQRVNCDGEMLGPGACAHEVVGATLDALASCRLLAVDANPCHDSLR